uniref:Uncharacterized protein n=1 Tax=viral metagenome TaxID=1070528 RepID=A0A6C0I611_9ZZZZ
MSNAQQLRDSSDVTTFRKQRAIIQNYKQLEGKGQLPIGGIPHEDLMAVARYGATYIPASSIMSTVLELSGDVQTLQYSTTEIAARSCSIQCSGSSYQPSLFIQEFRQ